jgi:hypothetical protein
MIRLWSAAIASLLAAAGAARADLITSPGQISGATQTLGFGQFSGGTTFLDPSQPPLQVGGPLGENITLTSSDVTASSFVGFSPGGPYLVGNNGQFSTGGPSGTGFVGLNSIDSNFLFTGTLTLRFNSGPVSAVGAFLNYSTPNNGPDVIISALDANNNVLQSFDLNQLAPINTPGGTDQEAFRGIVSATANITSFTISNEFAAVDTVTFSRSVPQADATVIPEPGSLVLLGAGLVLLAGYARRFWR